MIVLDSLGYKTNAVVNFKKRLLAGGRGAGGNDP
jgi:hypothetical protein